MLKSRIQGGSALPRCTPFAAYAFNPRPTGVQGVSENTDTFVFGF